MKTQISRQMVIIFQNVAKEKLKVWILFAFSIFGIIEQLKTQLQIDLYFT